MEPQREIDKAINKGAQALNSGFEAAEHRAEKIKDSFHSSADQLRSQARDFASDMKHRLDDAQEATTDFVKKYPIGTVAGAVGVGLLAGWLLHATTRRPSMRH